MTNYVEVSKFYFFLFNIFIILMNMWYIIFSDGNTCDNFIVSLTFFFKYYIDVINYIYNFYLIFFINDKIFYYFLKNFIDCF